MTFTKDHVLAVTHKTHKYKYWPFIGKNKILQSNIKPVETYLHLMDTNIV